ncbi:hypothetical protein [Pseudomonas baetica]|uniref:hypothetical protein n=1 Tax=Pseudomonas baetica TaxID=674054 RepID=UPI002406DDBC|nr:hypothetical protein [Pseudomonas baetica]MDF9778976.1 hypothetical protein [Pseudomonas baetica]
MSTESPLSIARRFAEANVATLSTDLLAWHKQTTLPEGCLFHKLAELCRVTSGVADDEYQQAETLVVRAALEQATYADALFAAISKYSAHGLSITLTETELAEIDDLVGKRQLPPAIDVAAIQGRLGALISTIQEALPDGPATHG